MEKVEEPLLNKSKDEISPQVQKKIDNLGFKSDAYGGANCLNKIFFWWAFRIIRLANATQLKADYMGNAEGTNDAKYMMKNVIDIWERKNYKKKKSCRLLLTILRANICRFLLMFFFSIFVMALEIVSVYLFRNYIQIFEHKSVWKFTATEVGCTFIGLKFFSFIINRQNNIIMELLGFQSGVELNCLIYDKVLKESPASSRKKVSEGQIVNFLQIDSQRLGWTLMSSPKLLVVPIQLAVYTYMLFKFFGISFLFGFGVMTIFIGFNFFLSNKFRVIFKSLMGAKDARMKVTTEIFNSLKVIKLYGWDNEFLRKVTETRDAEMVQYRKILWYANFSIFLLWCAPLAISAASIGAYNYFVDVMDIANVLTCINIFNLIQEPIRQLPGSINNILETMVSLKRIEEYMDQDEIEYWRMNRNNGDEENSIIVENGNYSWGKAEEADKKEEDKKENEKKKDEKKRR